MSGNDFQFRDEAFTEQHFSQRDRVTQNGGSRMLLCFCIDISQSMNLILDGYIEGRDYQYVNSRSKNQDGVSNVRNVQPLPGRTLMTRLTKLTDILCKMIRELKHQRDIADSVAICITAFSQYADVIQEFQDLRDVNEGYISRRLRLGASATNMAQGLSFAEREIKNQQNLLRQAQVDTCTPVLVVMSDGLPTDEYAAYQKQTDIRIKSDEGRLNVFTVFIGASNDSISQRFLRDMANTEKFNTMSTDREYDIFFEMIRNEISRSTFYAVADDPHQMAQPIETQTQNITDTTYGIVIDDVQDGVSLEELMNWE